MIGKQKKGQDFRGAVHYVMNDAKGADIIGYDGIILDSKDSIIKSFELQAEMNPNLTKNVGHHILSFHRTDAPRINDEYMLKIAQEYMERMGIRDTQYLIVRHYDKPHPHMHIVFNRVSNSGHTISDSNERYRSCQICRAITEREGLHLAAGKEEVKRNRLREPDKTRYRIFDIIKEELQRYHDFNKFIEAVENRGVECTLINNGSTNKAQGIRFKMGKYSFNGSKIDKSCSYSKLIKALEANRPKETIKPIQPKSRPERQESTHQELTPDFNLGLNLFQIHQGNDNVPIEECAWYKQRRRKKKGQSPK